MTHSRLPPPPPPSPPPSHRYRYHCYHTINWAAQHSPTAVNDTGAAAEPFVSHCKPDNCSTFTLATLSMLFVSASAAEVLRAPVMWTRDDICNPAQWKERLRNLLLCDIFKWVVAVLVVLFSPIALDFFLSRPSNEGVTVSAQLWIMAIKWLLIRSTAAGAAAVASVSIRAIACPLW